jgi:DNA-binding response OmpR family regulator
MSKVNILLIEPDLILGEIYKDFFAEKGFNVVLCNNGQKAIDAD